MTTFSLTQKQEEKLNEFLKEQEAIVLQEQKKKMNPAEWEDLTIGGKYPYYGAIGGEVQYIFIPTSIGVAVKIRYLPTNQELNLTDYDEW